MREIVFRGKRKDNGKWIEGYYFKKLNPHTEDGFPLYHGIADLPPFGAEVIPETVGQFTDLCDKNGKRIFEGDILKVKTMWHAEFPENEYGFPTSPIKTETYWSVEYKNFSGEMGFMVYGIDRRWHTKLTWNKLYNADAEVVGNIYDNPELLERSKENAE